MLQWLYGNSCTWAHDVRYDVHFTFMSCHKAIAVVKEMAHYFHDLAMFNVHVTLLLHVDNILQQNNLETNLRVKQSEQ